MPSASLNQSNMNNLVQRETYQANGLVRSQQVHQQQQPHQQSINLSQTSLQKLPASSPPQFLYSNGNNATTSNNNNNNSTNVNSSNQPLNHMQFPPPPPMASLVPSQPTQMPKQQLDPNQLCHSFNSLVVPQSQQQQQQPLSMPNMNGSNNLTQNSILMSPPSMLTTKNAQQPQSYHHLQQQQQIYQIQPQQQQLIQYPTNFMAGQQQQQQVPMTTIMIPATAAAQIQSASVQIQQAAMQAMAQNPGQPQILVFMIPYMMPQQQQQQPPTIPPTPEQVSLNSTLVRHSQSTNSLLRSSQHQSHQNQQQQQQQQQQQSVATTSSVHSRAVSSLSHNSKQEAEKFYIKANFTFQPTRNKMELSFQKGDILHVLDTLQNSEYGLQYWLATRVKTNGKDAEKGLIPDKNKAEEIALEQRTLNIGEPGSHLESGSSGVLSASVGRVNFLKRRSAQRSKSLCKDNWDNVVFDIGSFKLPVYERVIYKHPGFCRPVVIFGPLADVAREKLLKDYPEKYSYPTGFHQSQDHPRVIRLKGILEVVDQGKHALLDITPSAVEKLNYVNLAPIVIFMKTDSKSIIKEFRARAAKSLDPNARDEDTLRRDGKSSRKLLEQSIKLEKTWHHVFTATLNLSTMGSEMWYRKLRETIENQQSVNVWMGERKSDKKLNNIANNNSSLTSSNNDMVFPLSSNNNNSSNTQSSTTAVCMDSSSVLSERFSESLNITSKSTIDLLPDGTYGNRSQLRNAYAHSLAQKLARASSEPKLNGLGSDQDDVDDEEEEDDDDDDDNDDCIKKPFPEFENSSSVSSSNGAPSYGQGSLSGSNPMTYQHFPPPQPKQVDHHSSASLNRVQEAIYSRNPSSSIVNPNISNNANTTNANSGPYSNGGGASSSSNYHPLPPMVQAGSGGFQNQSMNNISNNSSGNANNVIDLSRNHDTRGSAFQVYSDMNQNNYHYYNLNKI